MKKTEGKSSKDIFVEEIMFLFSKNEISENIDENIANLKTIDSCKVFFEIYNSMCIRGLLRDTVLILKYISDKVTKSLVENIEFSQRRRITDIIYDRLKAVIEFNGAKSTCALPLAFMSDFVDGKIQLPEKRVDFSLI